mmetsp:Transcript_9257/g.37891  ORF Transcript_9257/g.37891 Transcript_9257/m.37891 type:complete len:346 (-) Transcript_9257:460-1497(-)
MILSEPKVERERRRERADVVPPPLRYEERIVRPEHGDEALPVRLRKLWKLFQIRLVRVHRRELVVRAVSAPRLDVKTRVANLGGPQPHELVPADLAQHVIRLVRVQVRRRAEGSQPRVGRGEPAHALLGDREVVPQAVALVQQAVLRHVPDGGARPAPSPRGRVQAVVRGGQKVVYELAQEHPSTRSARAAVRGPPPNLHGHARVAETLPQPPEVAETPRGDPFVSGADALDHHGRRGSQVFVVERRRAAFFRLFPRHLGARVHLPVRHDEHLVPHVLGRPRHQRPGPQTGRVFGGAGFGAVVCRSERRRLSGGVHRADPREPPGARSGVAPVVVGGGGVRRVLR